MAGRQHRLARLDGPHVNLPAADRNDAKPADQRAKERNVVVFDLGNRHAIARQQRHRHERVNGVDVVENENDRPLRRQVVQPLDGGAAQGAHHRVENGLHQAPAPTRFPGVRNGQIAIVLIHPHLLSA